VAIDLPTDAKPSSRIPNFFKLKISERLDALYANGSLSHEDVRRLANGSHQLRLSAADKMIENVVGVFGLPMGVALNFLINQKDYVIPLVVEEPSIVAGLSGAARIARLGGGYATISDESLLIGQVQTVISGDPALAIERLLARKDEILRLANSLHPKMMARGGGAVDIEAYHHFAEQDGRDMVVMHLLVDTREAMGANLVNSMCEGVGSLVESITGGKVFLRILSNLTDRALTTAKVRIPTANLGGQDYSGEQVRDGIILANDLALADPYRATTHNKGIMNGVDAVALATGNDWRAIEAGAHAYASRSGQYRALTRWYKGSDGELVGELEMPMKVGTVGGSLESNPSVRMSHNLLGSPSSSELAGIMGAVGLAQNFAALRSLSTNGIQQNHMNLHARTVASTASVPDEYFETVVENLIESGEIKVWKAKEIVRNLSRTNAGSNTKTERLSACGKVILLGEHAVVYGKPAIALPIPLAVEAAVIKHGGKGNHGVTLVVPRWGLEQKVHTNAKGPGGVLAEVFNRLGLLNSNITIEVFPHVPRAAGLGGSSAFAVAVLRAVNHTLGLGMDDPKICDLAFECEKAAHGTPSGVDNTVATYGTPLIYRLKEGKPQFKPIVFGQAINLVIGLTGQESLTAETVAQVRKLRELRPERCEGIFDQIEHLTLAGHDALEDNRFEELGDLMNLCHGFLNALQLSTPELEELIHIARSNGALGAKLTGGGGGGSMIALCTDDTTGIQDEMRLAGYDSLVFEIASA